MSLEHSKFKKGDLVTLKSFSNEFTRDLYPEIAKLAGSGIIVKVTDVWTNPHLGNKNVMSLLWVDEPFAYQIEDQVYLPKKDLELVFES